MDTCAAAIVTARNSAAMPRELLEPLFASIPPPKKMHVHTFTFTNKSSLSLFCKRKVQNIATQLCASSAVRYFVKIHFRIFCLKSRV